MESFIQILMSNSSEILIESFNQAGQGQVFQFFDELDAVMQEELVAQARTIDLAEVKELVEEHVKSAQNHTLNLDGLEPAPYKALATNGGDSTEWDASWDAGSVALRAGRVAASAALRRRRKSPREVGGRRPDAVCRLAARVCSCPLVPAEPTTNGANY